MIANVAHVDMLGVPGVDDVAGAGDACAATLLGIAVGIGAMLSPRALFVNVVVGGVDVDGVGCRCGRGGWGNGLQHSCASICSNVC